MQVIKSAVDCGDGVSIEREQPSTAFRSMPHYSNYGSTRLSAQPIDELTGGFGALNETTNVRPAKGESISIVDPVFKTSTATAPPAKVLLVVMPTKSGMTLWNQVAAMETSMA